MPQNLNCFPLKRVADYSCIKFNDYGMGAANAYAFTGQKKQDFALCIFVRGSGLINAICPCFMGFLLFLSGVDGSQYR